jgi:hypothetical protein
MVMMVMMAATMRYPWPSCRYLRIGRVPSWPWRRQRRRLGDRDGRGGVAAAEDEEKGGVRPSVGAARV